MHTQCIFCDIANKIVKAKVVWENDKFIAFEDINPSAPIHLLVIPKDHVEKTESIEGKMTGFWEDFYQAINEVIKKYELNVTGYKIINNGAGYNHLAHEHMHVLGGKDWKSAQNP